MAQLNSYLDQFLTFLSVNKQYSPHTISNYRRDIRYFIEFTSQDKNANLNDLTPRTCKQYLYLLRNKGYHTRTVARMIASLRSFWKYLNIRSITDKNPWEFLNLPKQPRVLPDVLLSDEMEKFLGQINTATTSGFRNRTICELIYSAGIRVHELTKLNITDLRLDEQEILIKGKGDKERIVLFGKTSKEYLEMYLSSIRPKWIYTDTEAVFLNTKGQRINPRSIQRFIKSEAERQGFSRKITPHTMRHSYATTLYNSGADLRTIQELLGHSSLSTTQIYTHINNEKLKKTYKRAHPHG